METKRERPSLSELMEKVTPENQYTEVDFGAPVGKEFPNEHPIEEESWYKEAQSASGADTSESSE